MLKQEPKMFAFMCMKTKIKNKHPPADVPSGKQNKVHPKNKSMKHMKKKCMVRRSSYIGQVGFHCEKIKHQPERKAGMEFARMASRHARIAAIVISCLSHTNIYPEKIYIHVQACLSIHA